MNHKDVLAKVREILIHEFEIPPSKVVPEATFMGTLGMDSLDVVDFVSYIEFAFEIDVGLQAYRDIDTVQKLVVLLIAEKATASGAQPDAE
jgi:acyl carrier protein